MQPLQTRTNPPRRAQAERPLQGGNQNDSPEACGFCKWWFEIQRSFLSINQIAMEMFSWHDGFRAKEICRPSGSPIACDRKQPEDQLAPRSLWDAAGWLTVRYKAGFMDLLENVSHIQFHTWMLNHSHSTATLKIQRSKAENHISYTSHWEGKSVGEWKNSTEVDVFRYTQGIV